MKPLTLIADSLASTSTVANQLRSKGARIVESNLKFGQYSVTDKCTIWHLGAADLARMLGDRSLYRHIPEFKRAVPEPIIIVEGDPTSENQSVSKRAMRGALTFLALHNRVPVLTAADAEEVAELIYIMANQAQNGMGMTVTETPNAEPAQADTSASGDHETAPKDPAELQEYILAAVPEVSPAIAKVLLSKYGNLRAVFAASAKDLTKLRGIGPKKAKKIADFFSGVTE